MKVQLQCDHPAAGGPVALHQPPACSSDEKEAAGQAHGVSFAKRYSQQHCWWPAPAPAPAAGLCTWADTAQQHGRVSTRVHTNKLGSYKRPCSPSSISMVSVRSTGSNCSRPCCTAKPNPACAPHPQPHLPPSAWPVSDPLARSAAGLAAPLNQAQSA